MALKAFDPGPPSRFEKVFATLPDYTPFKEHFWFDWGPVFYRGRLDGSARVLCIASDPGATERIGHRVLIGDAGQRVQGLLGKVGLTHSYLCLNAFAYAIFPSHTQEHASAILRDPAQRRWRNKLYDKAKGPSLQAIVAFGWIAREAVDLWPGKGSVPVFEVPHPSSHDEGRMLNEWGKLVTELRLIVTPDADGDPSLPNYGSTFREQDYAPVPRYDLPFGVPAFLGNDARARAEQPRRRSSVSRPSPDDRHTLIWRAPQS